MGVDDVTHRGDQEAGRGAANGITDASRLALLPRWRRFAASTALVTQHATHKAG